jgi:hypothetical protein
MFPVCSPSEGNSPPDPQLLWERKENQRPIDSLPKSPEALVTNICSAVPYHPWVPYMPFGKRHNVHTRNVSNSSHSPWHVLIGESDRNFHWSGVTIDPLAWYDEFPGWKETTNPIRIFSKTFANSKKYPLKSEAKWGLQQLHKGFWNTGC